ncbi:sensor histidine kinase [Croceicoccus bisphenolivorans]|uniref:sensor histidine kinase n=1 Tax=Croceicoccus bisphenolivorans TaxID=1783232 RepID=UPI00082AFBBB|nr:histidine kinase dimerization/phospho-acceptor domain-containing protein [Croceicoccus bisphenolivorans]
MTLDDRLRTVLDVAADSDDAARAQYRQLVDLLGSGKAVADGSLVAAAFLRLASLARRIPPAERASILADPALRLRSPPLVAQLCEGEPEVASAAIAAADLDEEGWTVLTGVLDEDLQGRIRTARTNGRARTGEEKPDLLMKRTPKRGSIVDELTPSAPVPSRAPAPPDPPVPETAEPSQVSDISEIVARIERFRVARREAAMHEVMSGERILAAAAAGSSAETDDAAPPPVAVPREIDCRISPDGRIGWASNLAPMLSGLILSATADATARLDEATATAIRRQQSVRGGKVAITASPTISGDWRLDAAPNFDPVGRFLGYHARLTREVGKRADPRGDLVRQALHELRTPINALQGFSEIIQQQLFGPVPHQYRSLAANIAGETAALLAGLEEIDRLVRLRMGTRKLAAGRTEVGPMLDSLVEQVLPLLSARDAHLDAHYADPHVTVAVAESDLERIVWRLLGVVAVAAREGDRIAFDVSTSADQLILSVGMPRALSALDDTTLYGAAANDDATQELAVGLLGRGFALRLLTAETRAAGGSLERHADRLVLTLPCEIDDESAGSEEAA